MITLRQFESHLKSVYLAKITEMLNTQTNPLLAKIEQTSADVWGKEIRTHIPLQLEGVRWSSDEEHAKLVNVEYATMLSTLKTLYATITFSDKAVREFAYNPMGDYLDKDMDKLLQDAQWYLGNVLYGDGSGKLATVCKDKHGLISVDNLRNLPLHTDCIVDVFRNGSKLTTSKINGYEVRCIEESKVSREIYFNEYKAEEGDEIYLQGGKDKQLTGLAAVFNNQQLYGLDKEKYRFMNPQRIEINGELTSTRLLNAIYDIEEETGVPIDMIVCSHHTRRYFMENGGFNNAPDIITINGGFKAFAIQGIPIISNKFMPDGIMYILNTKAFKLHQLCDWRWLEREDGSILWQVEGKPGTYKAVLVKYCDLICHNPSQQGILTGINY